jgi:hypothetical protein
VCDRLTNDKTRTEICSIPISTGYQKFDFGYQTVNDLYPDWILRKFQTLRKCETPLHDGLLIAFESYQFASNLLKDYVHFSVLMNCLVVDESPVVIVICNSESYGNLFSYLDGTGYNTYGNQYPEVGYWILRGDTKL